MRIGPLFKWFGSKWMSGKTLPQPKFDDIVEPFAGGAGYSLNHTHRQVFLCETDPHLCKLWPWLINEATESLIREIPINIPEQTDIRTLGLSIGQQLLLKNWQRTNNVGNCWTISPWGNKPGQWTSNTRARVSEEIQAIKHWQFRGEGIAYLKETSHMPSTWFVDPLYQFNYQYRCAKPHNYNELGHICKSLKGQVIVCEAICPKTGTVPSWLPFEFWKERITSRRKAENNHHSKELLWVNNT